MAYYPALGIRPVNMLMLGKGESDKLENSMGKLQLGEAERLIGNREAMKGPMGEYATGNRQQQRAALGKIAGIDPDKAAELRSKMPANDLDQLKGWATLFRSVKDPQSYVAALQAGKTAGLDSNGLPMQYNQNVVDVIRQVAGDAYTLKPGEVRMEGGLPVASVPAKADPPASGMVPDGKGGWRVDPAYENFMLRKSAAGAPSNTVTIEANKNKQIFEGDLKRNDKRLSDTEQLTGILPQVDAAMEILMTTGVETGPTQEAMIPVKKFIADAFGKDIPGLNEQLTLRAMIKYLTPRMRVSGSGSTSDKEMTAFEQSIGSMGNSPEANYLSMWTFKNSVQKNMELAQYERQMIEEGVSYAERTKKLKEADTGFYAKPKSEEEWNQLPKGTVYIDPVEKKLRIKGWGK